MKHAKKEAEFKNVLATKARGDEQYVSQLERHRTQLAEALRELYQLLEEYGPAWYTKDHHERAAFALRLLKESEPISSNNGMPPRYSAALSS